MMDMRNIEPNHESQPTGSTVIYMVLAVVVVVFVIIVLGIGFGTIDVFGSHRPELVCTIGDETIFRRAVDSAIQEDGVITITLDGYTSAIAQPTGGECYIAR